MKEGLPGFDPEKPSNRKFMQTVCLSPLNTFRRTESGFSFSKTFNIGRMDEQFIYFSEADKKKIGEIFKKITGREPAEIKSPKTRYEALSFSTNEKTFRGSVRGDTILARPLNPEGLLRVEGGRCQLPCPQSSFTIVASEVLRRFQIPSVVVVENLECFLHFSRLFSIDFTKAGREALVVFRGEVAREASTRSLYDFLKKTNAPVFAFVDYDPAGLLLAEKLPGFSGLIITKDRQVLSDLIQNRGRETLYSSQQREFKSLVKSTDQDVKWVKSLIHKSGKGLPQEIFIEA